MVIHALSVHSEIKTALMFVASNIFCDGECCKFSIPSKISDHDIERHLRISFSADVRKNNCISLIYGRRTFKITKGNLASGEAAFSDFKNSRVGYCESQYPTLDVLLRGLLMKFVADFIFRAGARTGFCAKFQFSSISS